MKERPILVCAQRVNAILRGERTQMRYPVESQCGRNFGVSGDRLWVKETWSKGPHGIVYRADGERPNVKWTSSRFMSRQVSRITLEIEDVYEQRLQDVSAEDAKKEGVTLSTYPAFWDASTTNHGLLWAMNPLVRVATFHLFNVRLQTGEIVNDNCEVSNDSVCGHWYQLFDHV